MLSMLHPIDSTDFFSQFKVLPYIKYKGINRTSIWREIITSIYKGIYDIFIQPKHID